MPPHEDEHVVEFAHGVVVDFDPKLTDAEREVAEGIHKRFTGAKVFRFFRIGDRLHLDMAFDLLCGFPLTAEEITDPAKVNEKCELVERELKKLLIEPLMPELEFIDAAA